MPGGRQVCRWVWEAKTRENRGLKNKITRKAKKGRVTRSTSLAIIEGYAKSAVKKGVSLHCELEFPVTKRKLRCNPPGYLPDYRYNMRASWREQEKFVDPMIGELDLGEPAIPLEEQEPPRYVEVKISGNVNYYHRDGEEE